MATLAIYARKSTESEDRQVLSIDSQIKELQQFAKREDLTISQVFKESKSAKAPGRPVFSEMMDLVHKGKIDGILCWKLDRLARNPVDGGAIIWAMEEKHLSQIATPQRTFENTGNDKFWMQLEFGMAKKYVDDLSDNVKRGIRVKIEQGWQPGIPPLGYLNDKLNHTIVKDPERFPVVRKMWDMMLSEKHTPREILEIATNRWGLRTRQFKKYGGIPVAYSAIYKIFTNPYYYGAITYNGEFNEGSHPKMITTREYDKVQQLLGTRGRPRPQKRSFAYTGIMKCGECGCAITAEHKANKRYGQKYIYYHCTKRKRQVKCSQPYIERQQLEKQIESFLDTVTIQNDYFVWCKNWLDEMHDMMDGEQRAIQLSRRKRLDAIESEVDKLLDCKLRSLITDEEYTQKRAALFKERMSIEELLTDKHKRFEDAVRMAEEAFEFARNARKRFEDGSDEDRADILRYTGSNLFLKDKKLLIEPQKPLLFIQNAVRATAGKKAAFEPRILSYSQAKKEPVGSLIHTWQGCVEEVRTFFMESLFSTQ